MYKILFIWQLLWGYDLTGLIFAWIDVWLLENLTENVMERKSEGTPEKKKVDYNKLFFYITLNLFNLFFILYVNIK